MTTHREGFDTRRAAETWAVNRLAVLWGAQYDKLSLPHKRLVIDELLDSERFAQIPWTPDEGNLAKHARALAGAGK